MDNSSEDSATTATSIQFSVASSHAGGGGGSRRSSASNRGHIAVPAEPRPTPPQPSPQSTRSKLAPAGTAHSLSPMKGSSRHPPLSPQAQSPPPPPLRPALATPQASMTNATASSSASLLEVPVVLHPSRSVSPSDASLLFVQAVAKLDTPQQTALHGQAQRQQQHPSSSDENSDDDPGNAHGGRYHPRLASHDDAPRGRSSNLPVQERPVADAARRVASANVTNQSITSSGGSIEFQEDEDVEADASPVQRKNAEEENNTSAAPSPPAAAPAFSKSLGPTIVSSSKALMPPATIHMGGRTLVLKGPKAQGVADAHAMVAAPPLSPGQLTKDAPSVAAAARAVSTPSTQSRAGSSSSPPHNPTAQGVGLPEVIITTAAPAASSIAEKRRQQQQQALQDLHLRTHSLSSPASPQMSTAASGANLNHMASFLHEAPLGGLQQQQQQPIHWRVSSASVQPEDDPVYCTVSEMTNAASMRGGTYSLLPIGAMSAGGASAAAAAAGGYSTAASSRRPSMVPPSATASRRVQSFDMSLDESNGLLTMHTPREMAGANNNAHHTSSSNAMAGRGVGWQAKGSVPSQQSLAGEGAAAFTPSPNALSPSPTHQELHHVMPLPTFSQPANAQRTEGDQTTATGRDGASSAHAKKEAVLTTTNVNASPLRSEVKPSATRRGRALSDAGTLEGGGGPASPLQTAASPSESPLLAAKEAVPTAPPHRRSSFSSFLNALGVKSLPCRTKSGSTASKSGTDDNEEEHSTTSLRSHQSASHSIASGLSRMSSRFKRGAQKAIPARRTSDEVPEHPQQSKSKADQAEERRTEAGTVLEATTNTTATMAPADLPTPTHSINTTRANVPLVPRALSPTKLQTGRSSPTRGQTSSVDGSIDFHTDAEETKASLMVQEGQGGDTHPLPNAPHPAIHSGSEPPSAAQAQDVQQAPHPAQGTTDTAGKRRRERGQRTSATKSDKERRHHRRRRHRRTTPEASALRSASSSSASTASSSTTSCASSPASSTSLSSNALRRQKERERRKRRRRRRRERRERRRRESRKKAEDGETAEEEEDEPSQMKVGGNTKANSAKARKHWVASSNASSASQPEREDKRRKQHHHRHRRSDKARRSTKKETEATAMRRRRFSRLGEESEDLHEAAEAYVRRRLQRSCERRGESTSSEDKDKDLHTHASSKANRGAAAKAKIALHGAHRSEGEEEGSHAALLAARRRTLRLQSRVHSTVDHFAAAWHTRSVGRQRQWQQQCDAYRDRKRRLQQAEAERKLRSQDAAIAAAVATAASRSASRSRAAQDGTKQSTNSARASPEAPARTRAASLLSGDASRRLESYEAALTSDIIALDTVIEKKRRHELWAAASPTAAAVAAVVGPPGQQTKVRTVPDAQQALKKKDTVEMSTGTLKVSEIMKGTNSGSAARVPRSLLSVAAPVRSERPCATSGGSRVRRTPALTAGPLSSSSLTVSAYADSLRWRRRPSRVVARSEDRSAMQESATLRGGSSPAPRKPPTASHTASPSVSSSMHNATLYEQHRSKLDDRQQRAGQKKTCVVTATSISGTATSAAATPATTVSTTAELQRRYEKLLDEIVPHEEDAERALPHPQPRAASHTLTTRSTTDTERLRDSNDMAGEQSSMSSVSDSPLDTRNESSKHASRLPALAATVSATTPPPPSPVTVVPSPSSSSPRLDAEARRCAEALRSEFYRLPHAFLLSSQPSFSFENARDGKRSGASSEDRAVVTETVLKELEVSYAQALRPSCAGCRPQSFEEYVTLGMLSLLHSAEKTSSTDVKEGSGRRDATALSPAFPPQTVSTTLLQRRIREDLYAPPKRSQRSRAIAQKPASGAAAPSACPASSSAVPVPEPHPFTPSVSLIFDALRTRVATAEQHARIALIEEEVAAVEVLRRRYIVETICVLRALRAKEDAEAAEEKSRERRRLQQQRLHALSSHSFHNSIDSSGQPLENNGDSLNADVVHEPVTPAFATPAPFSLSAMAIGENFVAGSSTNGANSGGHSVSNLWRVPGNSSSSTSRSSSESTSSPEMDSRGPRNVDSDNRISGDNSPLARSWRGTTPPPQHAERIHEGARHERQTSVESDGHGAAVRRTLQRDLSPPRTVSASRFTDRSHSPLSATRNGADGVMGSSGNHQDGKGDVSRDPSSVTVPGSPEGFQPAAAPPLRKPVEQKMLRLLPAQVFRGSSGGGSSTTPTEKRSMPSTPPSDSSQSEAMRSTASDASELDFIEEDEEVCDSRQRKSNSSSIVQQPPHRDSVDETTPVFELHDEDSRATSTASITPPISPKSKPTAEGSKEAAQTCATQPLPALPQQISSMNDTPEDPALVANAKETGKSNNSSNSNSNDGEEKEGKDTSSSLDFQADDDADVNEEENATPKVAPSLAPVTTGLFFDHSTADKDEANAKKKDVSSSTYASASAAIDPQITSVATAATIPDGGSAKPEKSSSSSGTVASPLPSPPLPLLSPPLVKAPQPHAEAAQPSQETPTLGESNPVRPLSIDRGDHQLSSGVSSVDSQDGVGDVQSNKRATASTEHEEKMNAGEEKVSSLDGDVEKPTQERTVQTALELETSLSSSSSSTGHKVKQLSTGIESADQHAASQEDATLGMSAGTKAEGEGDEEEEHFEVHTTAAEPSQGHPSPTEVSDVDADVAATTVLLASRSESEVDLIQEKEGRVMSAQISANAAPVTDQGDAAAAAAAKRDAEEAENSSKVSVHGNESAAVSRTQRVEVGEEEEEEREASTKASPPTLDAASQTPPMILAGAAALQYPSRRVRFSLPLEHLNKHGHNDEASGEEEEGEVLEERERETKEVHDAGEMAHESPERFDVAAVKPEKPTHLRDDCYGDLSKLDGEVGQEKHDSEDAASEKTAIDLIEKLNGLDALLLYKFPSYFVTGIDSDGLPGAVMRLGRGSYTPKRHSLESAAAARSSTSMEMHAAPSSHRPSTSAVLVEEDASATAGPVNAYAQENKQEQQGSVSYPASPEINSEADATDQLPNAADSSPASASTTHTASLHEQLAPPRLPEESLATQLRRKYGLRPGPPGLRRTSMMPHAASYGTSAVPFVDEFPRRPTRTVPTLPTSSTSPSPSVADVASRERMKRTVSGITVRPAATASVVESGFDVRSPEPRQPLNTPPAVEVNASDLKVRSEAARAMGKTTQRSTAPQQPQQAPPQLPLPTPNALSAAEQTAMLLQTEVTGTPSPALGAGGSAVNRQQQQQQQSRLTAAPALSVALKTTAATTRHTVPSSQTQLAESSSSSASARDTSPLSVPATVERAQATLRGVVEEAPPAEMPKRASHWF